ncbi:MAG: DUF3179 domain-containing protein [Haloferacaceae archaeon]
MDRRGLLTWVAMSATGGFAGCTSGGQSGNGSGSASPAAATAATEQASKGRTGRKSVAGVNLPVPESEFNRGTSRDSIPAITDPVFASDWSGVTLTVVDRFGNERTIEPRLHPDDRVIGVNRDGTTRAYPLRVLNWHEIVNDSFAGPLLVTYCPLCGSAMAATRTVNGEATMFGVSGLLWNSNLVMYDERTGSLWSQTAATAIRGPETGKRLSLVSAMLTTWDTWKQEHPRTSVLLPPPESNTVRGEIVRNYNRNPYSGYERNKLLGIGSNEVPESDAHLHPKTRVLGITSDGGAKAYPLPAVLEAGVVNDTVGELPVVVAVASDRTTLVGYVRRADGETLRFDRATDTHLRAAGSRWKLTTGRAVDGPHTGTILTPAATEPQMFWFAWLDFHPDTTVYPTDQ